MSTPASKPTEGRRALLRCLQREGKIAAEDVARLEKDAQEKSVSVAEVLEAEGIITEKDLAVFLATTLRLRLIDLTSYPFDPQMARELKEPIATRYNVVPIRLDEHSIEVATANPLDIEALKAVEFATGKRVHALIATRQEVHDALAHVYRLQESLDQFLQHVPDESVTLNELRDEGNDLRTIAREAELPPVVKLADLILIEGIKSRASDVHIEPGTDAVAVRYRIDGILEESFRFPKWVQNALIARLKVMAKLDITERRVPQDGRIQLRYTDRIVDLRVSSLPAQHGEKITLRILDATTGIKALDRLGFNDVDLQRMRDAIRKPEGLILVTGPTGSGKTTTLYALLREKFSPNLNIVTIENPIEYQLKGINQVEVNDKQGLTFAGVLRSVLRQDPDVILIGEIRDAETAQIAMQAAQTGHLVLSTVHTNDATAAITRLIDLGVEPFVVASTMHLIVAQRLVRRVCQSCCEPYEPSADSRRLLRLDDAAVAQLRRSKGCAACRQTGYAGRNGVYEVMPISPAMTKLIEANATESVIRQQARTEGFTSIVESAREKLLTGLTTPEEVLRVVQVNDYTPRCPGCNREIEEDYTVCPHCSAVLRTTCRECGKELTAGWTSCAYCGASTKADAGDATAGQEASGDASENGGRHRSYKALVVDDNAAIREIVRLTIERSQLSLAVVVAEDGPQALAVAAAERPDVVILDLQMPGMDGFEVCRRLRSDVRTAFVPVLMLSAQTSEESITQGFASGADDYVTKPFRRQDLLTRIRRMLERTYGKAAATSEDPATSMLYIEPTSDAAPALADERGAIDVGTEATAAEGDAYVRSSPSSPVSAALQTELNEVRRGLERMQVEHERALEQLRGETKATTAELEKVEAALRGGKRGRSGENPADGIADLRADMARREAALDAQIAALTSATDLEELRASVRDLEKRLAATAPNVEVGALMRAIEHHEQQLAALSDRFELDKGSKSKGGKGKNDADAATASRVELEALRTRTQELDEGLALVRREADCGALRAVVEQQKARLETLADRLEREVAETGRGSAERVTEALRDLAATRADLADVRRTVTALVTTQESTTDQAAFEQGRAAEASSTTAALDRLAADTAERLAATLGVVEALREDVERRIAEHDATLETRFLGRAHEREIEALRTRTQGLDERVALVAQEADCGALRDAVEQQKAQIEALADRLEHEVGDARRELGEMTAEISRRAEEDAARAAQAASTAATLDARLDALVDRLEHEVGKTDRVSAERVAEVLRDLAATRADLADVRHTVAELATAQESAADAVRRELAEIAAESAAAHRTAVELIESRVESVQVAFEQASAAQVASTAAALDRLTGDTTERLAATVEAFEELRTEMDRQAESVRELLAAAATAAADADGFEASVMRLETRQAADREALSTIVQKCEARLAALEGRIGAADDLTRHVVEELSRLASHVVPLGAGAAGERRGEHALAPWDAGTGWRVVEHAEAVLHRIYDVSAMVGSLLEYVKVPIAAALLGSTPSDADTEAREERE
ncbi:MAG: Flp pilus assembly complex ATPase component TadA [Deltaproteobacteria bacterium]|nr:Flp pilus assembly complex ATPase component TadA [Deltaproteobacteria bacterium]